MQNAVNHIAAACAAVGIKHAVICPGSRNAPLTMAFARHPEITCYSVVDERSAAFIALGMAQANHFPVALICTSGSAVVNFYPAITEAFYQRVPLLVVTADRPPELIDQWDGQAMHQPGVFGKHVKASYNLPAEYDDPKKFSRLTIKAFKTAYTGKEGPVHINVPLREPLYTAVHEKFTYPRLKKLDEYDLEDLQKRKEVDDKLIKKMQQAINKSKKVLIVAGAMYSGSAGGLDEHENVPCIAEISGRDFVLNGIKNVDTILSINRDELKKQLQPEVLITTGTSVVSKNLKLFLRKYKPVYHFHLAVDPETADPFGTQPTQVTGRMYNILNKLDFSHLDNTYAGLWKRYDFAVGKLGSSIIGKGPFNEMTAVQRVLSSLPERTRLQLSNSMPVRWANILDVPYYMTACVYSNRGVAGIDGCTSTAVGMACIYADYKGGEPPFVTLITGDVAFFYDSNALWNKFAPANLRIVVLNNGGGGIFRLIDGPGSMPELEEFVETRHTRTAKLLAQDYGVEYASAENFKELDAALKEFYKPSKGPKILEIITDSKITAEFFKEYKKRINELEI